MDTEQSRFFGIKTKTWLIIIGVVAIVGIIVGLATT